MVGLYLRLTHESWMRLKMSKYFHKNYFFFSAYLTSLYIMSQAPQMEGGGGGKYTWFCKKWNRRVDHWRLRVLTHDSWRQNVWGDGFPDKPRKRTHEGKCIAWNGIRNQNIRIPHPSDVFRQRRLRDVRSIINQDWFINTSNKMRAMRAREVRRY